MVDPLISGDYPKVMKKNVGHRLPEFTPVQSKEVKGSADFMGLIHYTSNYVKDKSSSLNSEPRDFNLDMAVELCKFSL